jgi:benzoylformate decarboxylase
MDVLDETGEVEVPTASRIERGATAGRLDELADLLAGAAPGKLAIVAVDEVAAAGAVEALVEVAEALGAPVPPNAYPRAFSRESAL